jgi:hypothetical protein
MGSSMARLPGLASLAAVSALLLTAPSLACKPTGTAPPATASPPTASIAPPATANSTTAKVAPWRRPFIVWTSACSPGDADTSTCTAEQPPVCGQKSDLTRATFDDSCAACRDPGVLYYSPGACRDEPSSSLPAPRDRQLARSPSMTSVPSGAIR